MPGQNGLQISSVLITLCIQGRLPSCTVDAESNLGHESCCGLAGRTVGTQTPCCSVDGLLLHKGSYSYLLSE